MPDPGAFALFLMAALVLAVTPGPAVLYVVTRSLGQGRGAALASTLGIAAGGLVHVLAAAVGLSVVLATSATAYALVKYAGAGYLMWLGLRKLTARTAPSSLEPDAPRSRARVFWEGVAVNVLNPKTALFFLAFLPQFVRPSAGSPTLQFLFLGLSFVAVAFCTDTAWALLAGRAGGWLRSHPRFVRSEGYVSGSVYFGLGVATAVSGDGRGK
jgi:threonine/homoserine/homoserine lactone efflux protein